MRFRNHEISRRTLALGRRSDEAHVCGMKGGRGVHKERGGQAGEKGRGGVELSDSSIAATNSVIGVAHRI